MRAGAGTARWIPATNCGDDRRRFFLDSYRSPSQFRLTLSERRNTSFYNLSKRSLVAGPSERSQAQGTHSQRPLSKWPVLLHIGGLTLSQKEALRETVWVIFWHFRSSPLWKIPPDPPLPLAKGGWGDFPKGGTRTNVRQFTSYQPILPTPFYEEPTKKGPARGYRRVTA